MRAQVKTKIVSLLDCFQALSLTKCTYLRMWELTFMAVENENPRVESKPLAHVKPDEALSLSPAFLQPF